MWWRSESLAVVVRWDFTIRQPTLKLCHIVCFCHWLPRTQSTLIGCSVETIVSFLRHHFCVLKKKDKVKGWGRDRWREHKWVRCSSFTFKVSTATFQVLKFSFAIPVISGVTAVIKFKFHISSNLILMTCLLSFFNHHLNTKYTGEGKVCSLFCKADVHLWNWIDSFKKLVYVVYSASGLAFWILHFLQFQ